MTDGALQRFLTKFEPEPNSGCWLWTAFADRLGYGRMWDGTATKLPYRLAYEHWRGPIPTGLVLDHLCRVSSCVNPAHLEAVPQAINVSRGLAGKVNNHSSAKTHCPVGHPYDGENVYSWRGRRFCRLCVRAHGRLHDSKRGQVRGELTRRERRLIAPLKHQGES